MHFTTQPLLTYVASVTHVTPAIDKQVLFEMQSQVKSMKSAR